MTALYTSLHSLALGEIRLNEILASNDGILLDEDGDSSDWIELKNTGPTAVNLAGYYLTDDGSELTKWRIPSVLIPPNGFLLFFASDKNRADPSAELHTNFKLSANGEYLALVGADGTTIIDEFAPEFPEQESDISYGWPLQQSGELQFFPTPTPLAENLSGELIPPQSIEFSQTSQSFIGLLEVTLTSGSDIADIFYTLDGSLPDQSSSRYPGAIFFDSTTTLRVAAYDESGELVLRESHHYIAISPELATRQSNLPTLIISTGGQSLNGNTRRAGFLQIYARDEAGVSSLANKPSTATRMGVRYRGSSSQGFAKKPYSLECWGEDNDDRDITLLGMPPESDWVLSSSYRYDRALTRNALAYELSRRMGRYAPRTRFVEVYLDSGEAELGTSSLQGVYTLTENVKLAKNRVGFNTINEDEIPPEVAPPLSVTGEGTGGYLLKIDRVNSDELRWRTEANLPIAFAGARMVLDKPKLGELDGGPFQDSTQAFADSQQAQYIRNYIQEFENALLADHASDFLTRTYRSYIDDDSFLDLLLLNIFTKNIDGLRLSTFFHKDEDFRLAAGPAWDFDRSLNSYDGRGGAATNWSVRNYLHFDAQWWRYLMGDPDFEQRFYDRWAELRSDEWSNTALEVLVNALINEIDIHPTGETSAAERERLKWRAYPPAQESHRAENDRMLNWMLARADWMDRRDRDSSLLPDAPNFEISDGQLAFENPANIYFTRDGSDPRGISGVQSGAPFTSPFPTGSLQRIVARRFLNSKWSTPTKVDFTPIYERYAQWQKAAFTPAQLDEGAGTEPNEAVSGSLANLLYYALGALPSESIHDRLPDVSITQSGGSITFTPNLFAEDLTITLEGSADLTTWEEVQTWNTFRNETALADDGSCIVPFSAAEGLSYFRLNVSLR